MSEKPSPLARLVLVMICLSIAGSIVAGAHYYVVDLPQQKALQAPANSACGECTRICQAIWTGNMEGVQAQSRCLDKCYSDGFC